MPSYNKGEFIAEAIQSVMRQTYSNWELVISDDLSNDESDKICREFAAADPRILYFRQSQNLGMIENFNFVLHQAKGEFFMWLSSDDRIDDNWLEVTMGNFRDEVSISFGKVVDVSRDGAIVREYPCRSVRGPVWQRMLWLYWFMYAECNFLHGLSKTSRLLAMNGLDRYRHVGQAFDSIYVWESALDGQLASDCSTCLYKRDSINNGQLASSSIGGLVKLALIPSLPIKRILWLHSRRLPIGIRTLLALNAVPRMLLALVRWYAKGVSIFIKKFGLKWEHGI